MDLSKGVLRREIKDRLGALAPEYFHEEGRRAASWVSSGSYWDLYQSILLFLSTGLEINTQPLLEAAFSGQKGVFLPKITGGGLRFYRVSSPAGPWREGPFHIREPAGNTETLKPEDGPLLVIVPGLAFDPAGNRLGRGKGYYDRFLAELDGETPAYKTIGLCMEIQVLPQVPREEWDKRMDALCTGRGLTHCRSF
jgi:5-formyltetrahydrofolate cyclo-ligase